MTDAQFKEFMFWQENNARMNREFLDEQFAKLANVLSPDTYNECVYCNKITTSPWRTFDEHGDDFCSEFCFNEYVEDLENDIEEKGIEIAEEKMKKFSKWHEIQDSVFKSDVIIAGVKINHWHVETIKNEEDRHGCVGPDDEYVEYYYSIKDANYVLDCQCTNCNNKFEIKAEKLLTVRQNPCPKCK